MPKQSKDEREVLRNIADAGAKHILDGLADFPSWTQRVMLDIADQVRWIAAQTKQTPDAVLQQIYDHAVHIATLMQEGHRLAAISWADGYANIVGKQIAAESNAAESKLPKLTTDSFQELCNHPATPIDRSRGALVFLGILAVIAAFFLVTDRSALLDSRFGWLLLTVLAFLVFFGSVLGYVWIRERFRSTSSADAEVRTPEPR